MAASARGAARQSTVYRARWRWLTRHKDEVVDGRKFVKSGDGEISPEQARGGIDDRNLYTLKSR
jgi:hypothetical protein